MTKFLNLDEVVPESEKAIILGGEEHPMTPLSVKQYIENVKELEALGEEADPEDQVNISLKILTRAFPTVTKEMWDGLTMEQMNALSGFVQQDAEDGAPEGEEVEGSSDAEGK